MATSKNFEVKNGLSVGGTERISSAGVGTFTDLNVTGTTTTIDTATLQVQDKNIVINYGTGDTSSTASGAGITIQDAVDASNDATLLWDASADEFDFSHTVTAPSLTIAGNAVFDTSTLVVDSSNNRVGIGIASAAKPLHVYSSDNHPLRVESSDAYAGIEIKDNGSATLPPLHSVLQNDHIFYGGHASARPELVRMQADGKVGIGTSSPSTLLTVGDGTGTEYITIDKSTTGESGILFKNAGNNKGKILLDSNEHLRFYVNNTTNAMTILESGNVGIGVASPGYKLCVNSKLVVGDSPGVGLSGNTIHVRENSNSGIHFPLVIGGGTHSAGAAFGIGLDPEGYGNRNKIAILAEGNGAGYSRGRLHFAIDANNDSNQVTLADSKMCITENGHVGIGAQLDSPDRLLHVKGTSTSTVAKFANTGSTVYVELNADNQAGGDAGYIAYNDSKVMSLWTDDTQQMSINSSGDVHFNHLSNDFRLRGGVYGSLFDSSPNMNHNIRYHSSAGMYFNTGTTNGQFIFEQRGTGRFTIDSSGGSPSSDRKLKENIEDITYGLDTVKQLQPRKFDWKGEDIPADEKASIGFIAQEVESLIPEVVNETTHPDDPGDGSRNIKRLNYSAMTSVLVKAIQELEARVKELEG